MNFDIPILAKHMRLEKNIKHENEDKLELDRWATWSRSKCLSYTRSFFGNMLHKVYILLIFLGETEPWSHSDPSFYNRIIHYQKSVIDYQWKNFKNCSKKSHPFMSFWKITKGLYICDLSMKIFGVFLEPHCLILS